MVRATHPTILTTNGYTLGFEITSLDTRRLSHLPSVELPTSLPFSTMTFPRKIVMIGYPAL
jgi:hypothetical protein